MSRPRILVVDDHFELAELLAAALENEGLVAVVAREGEEALSEARTDRFDLAIIDLVLPDMLGMELLDAFAKLEPPVPTVAMSGVFRGERYNRDATHRHGALCFFEKPFSTTAVVSEILTILKDLGDAPRPEEATDAAGPMELDLATTVQPSTSEELASFPDAATVLGKDEPGLQREAGGESRESPQGRALPSKIKGSDSTSSPVSDRTEHQRRQRRQMGFVEDLVQVDARPAPEGGPPASSRDDLDPALPSRSSDLSVKPGLPPRRKVPPRGGEIAETTVPRLLAAVHEAGSTGALELQRGRVNKVVYLRDGQPTFAASNLAGDRLIGFAVNRGVLSQEDAESVLSLARDERRRIGEVLVELGVLDRRTLHRLVRDQVRAVIWSTFSWREGRYAIRPHREGRKEPITLSFPLGKLILEGTLRAVPLLVLRTDLPDEVMLAPQPAPVIPVESLNLGATDARVLVATDGTKSVGDLLTLFDEKEKDVRALLKALCDLGVLAPREQLDSRSRRIGFVV